MTVEECFEYLVKQLISKSSCGRLELKEREAIRTIRKYLSDHEQGISS